MYILTLYTHQILSSQALHTSKIPIYKKEEKLIHEFILYTRNFLHENEKQILHNGEYQ